MQILSGQLIRNELTKNAKGGSELMAERLQFTIPQDLLSNFQIILSRVRDMDYTKHRILWCHDLADDPESRHLSNNGWNKFNMIVFVSYWQRQQYINRYHIPYHKTMVIQNGIIPFSDNITKDFDTVKFIYHTTPHRGLEILIPVFLELAKHFPNIHLDVYSSFNAYGWPERDKPYEGLFDLIKNDEKMTYHGFKPNSEIREALIKANIYAYPCIWPETSCLSLIEAMAANVICVHSDLAALPETSSSGLVNHMYSYVEDPSMHASILYRMLTDVLSNINNKPAFESLVAKSKMAQDYSNTLYDWNILSKKWEMLLKGLLGTPKLDVSHVNNAPGETTNDFIYRSN